MVRKNKKTDIDLALIVFAIMITTFLLDLQLPLGVACGVPYVGAVLFSLYFKTFCHISIYLTNIQLFY